MAWVESPFQTVEGRTQPIQFRLSDEDGPLALSGYTPGAAQNGIALYMRDDNGRVVSTTGKVDVVDDGVTAALLGRVDFYPSASDLLAKNSGYTLRWELTNNSGLVIRLPDTEMPCDLIVGRIT